MELATVLDQPWRLETDMQDAIEAWLHKVVRGYGGQVNILRRLPGVPTDVIITGVRHVCTCVA